MDQSKRHPHLPLSRNSKMNKELTGIAHYDGEKLWFQDGKLHRTVGPAVEHPNGTKEWYLNGKKHRTDGPALEDADGTKSWFQNGKWHRTDGPAIEHPDGTKEWYLFGEKYEDLGLWRVTSEMLVLLFPDFGRDK